MGTSALGPLPPIQPTSPNTDPRQLLSPVSAQRPTPHSPPTPPPALPPIHRRESPSPRSPVQPTDQTSPMPRLPPIHGDPGSEPQEAHTTDAAAAEEQPSPQGDPNQNWPTDLRSMSKNQRRAWKRANPQPTPTQPPQPEPEPQQATPPIPKPKNWSTMTPSEKEHWLYKHK
jgi:hypothetical protein